MKMSRKLFIAPAIILLFTFGFGIVSFWGLESQKAAINGMYTSSFASYKKSSEIFVSLQNTHANIYKLIAWATAKYDEKRIDELSKSQTAELKSVVEKIQQVINSPQTNKEAKKLYQDILGPVTEYTKQATDMVDMIQSDLNAATMYAQMAEDKFQTLDTGLKALHNYEEKQAESTYAVSLANYNRVLAVCFGVLLVAVLCSVGISVALNRIILAPIKSAISVIEVYSVR
jgi:hypothetical protein